MVQGGGEGVDGASPLGFCCASTFWRDFAVGCLVESGFDVLYKMRYLLWVGVLLGACDVIQDGGEYGRHLGFYQKLERMKKRRKMEIVNASHVKYDIIKHFAAFVYN